MKNPQHVDAHDKSQANSPVLWHDAVVGADGINSVRLHLLVRSSKCGADPTSGSQIQRVAYQY
jgi:hypothetical protein